MAGKYARVEDPTYVFRGVRLGKGTIVQLSAAQLKETEGYNPPRLKEVSEPKQGTPFVDIRPKTVVAQPETGPAPERPPLKSK